MNACKIIPDQIADKDGVMRDPILFEDLLKATNNNQNLSMLIYNMVDQELLDKYGHKFKYDEQGNPTLKSLRSIPAIAYVFNLNDDQVLQNLQKQFKVGIYTYDEAIQKVGAFNRNESFNKDYLATITEITEGKDKGKVKFDIVKNTARNKRALQDIIEGRTFRDKLLYILSKAGVKVDFVDPMLMEHAGVEGIYTTKQPQKFMDALFNVIRISELKAEDLDLLKEEISHLLVGIAENHASSKSIFNRLVAYLRQADDAVLKELLRTGNNPYTEEKAEQILQDVKNDPDKIREIAGRLISLELDGSGPALLFNISDSEPGAVKTLKRGYNAVYKTARALSGRVLRFLKMIVIDAINILGQTGAATANSILRPFDKNIDFKYTNRNYRPDLEQLKSDIRFEARTIASKFMKETLGSIEDALGTEEERHHESLEEARVSNRLINSFNNFIKLLSNTGMTTKESRALSSLKNNALRSKDFYMQLAKKLSNPNTARPKRLGETEEEYQKDLKDSARRLESEGYFNVISEMLNSIGTLVKEIQDNDLEALKTDDFEGKLNRGLITFIPDFNQKVQIINKLLNTLRLCDEVELIMSEINGTTEQAINFNLDEKKKSISDMKNAMESQVRSINKAAFKATLATINGGKMYIERGKRMGWGKKIEAKTISFDELIAGVDDDGRQIAEEASAWGVYCQKMGSSISVINQLASNLYDFNKAEANKDMYRYSQILLDFHERIKKEFGDEDTGFLYEYDENGVATGNIVQPDFNYGKWEQDYAEWKKYTYKKLRVTALVHSMLGSQYNSLSAIPRDVLEDTLSKIALSNKLDTIEDIDEYISNAKKFYAELVSSKMRTSFNEMNTFQRSELLWRWFKPLYEEWHSKNSQIKPETYINDLFDETNPFEEKGSTIKYLPASKYASDQWNHLGKTPEETKKKQEFVKEYIKIKQSLDQFIEEYHPGSVTSYRLPQFRGTTIARMRNKGYVSTKNGERAKMNGLRTMHDQFIETFFEDALDTDFGDNSCYNSDEDTFFDMKTQSDKELSRRIPVFGVNKLEDMHNLSRDIVYSTMQYAAMAINVKGMTTTATVLQNGLDIVNETKVGSQIEKTKGSTSRHSNVYDRYVKFLEMQVFGQRSSKIPIFTTKNGKKLLLNKISNWINKEGSWWLLAGKMASGAVNTGTGINQILKEGMVGDHYTMTELTKAVSEYSKYAISANFTEGLAPLNRSNKMYSFIRYFDVLNQNEQYFNSFTSHQQLSKWSQLRKLNYAMWVYESGNHFIQTIPYIAKGMHTKLYKAKEGVDITDNDIKTQKDIVNFSSNFVNEDGMTVWDLFDEGQLQRGEKVDKYRQKKEKATGETIVAEKPQIINDQDSGTWGNPYQGNYYIKNPDGTFVRWDRTAQSRFQTQCRYMTDNMHGIYNSADALAIQQDWLGASILTMKKYLFGYVDKFTLGDRYSAAESKDVEGSVITWLKLLNWAAKGNSTTKDTFKIFGMGVPILLSAINDFGYGSQIVSTACSLAYLILSKSGAGVINNKSMSALDKAGFSEYQQFNLRRFDTEMKMGLILRLIGNLISNGLYGHEKDDDDDEFNLSKGEILDNKVLEYFGYTSYTEDLERELTTSRGNIRKSAKTPGLVYTFVQGLNDSDDNQGALYWMGMAYYFVHRWSLEQSTLFPFDINKDTFTEMQTQWASYFHLYPVGISQLGATIKMVANISENANPNYEYFKEAESFEDIWNESDFNENNVIPEFIKCIRTGQHLYLGENKGLNKMFNMIPYLNSMNVFYDPYKGATSYDFGRTMTSH